MSGFASFVSVLAGLFACTAAAATFDVTAWGAKPDGKTDCTAAIQKAIERFRVSPEPKDTLRALKIGSKNSI